ncbi:hypothetical protein ACODG7_00525 [Vibrio anguillarum]|uniref:hypothetical protein n=1 Tax=Vibrio anguillarum TaxID=55601 RepID=UPI00035EB761|nr:hypothetical protein [Vibrio anguillarum]OEE32005.1 hypothetical protein A1QW_12050 [Vibrio anguillarum]OEF90958.1 hypothetical protein A1QY_01310 [Vibrio anguillarum]
MKEICGFNEVQYYAFRELFHDKLVLQHKYIATETLRVFFNDNVLLNQWCMLRDLDITEAITKLNTLGISYQYPSLLKDGILLSQ